MTTLYNREALGRAHEWDPYRFIRFSARRPAGYNAAKRLIDVAGALCGLLLLSPLLAAVALLIKLDDPHAPIFFAQTRIGQHGKPFRLLKFRSMVPDAERKLADLLALNEIRGAMFKMKDDPRVTRIGRFIRKTSIDELPQLVNVLKGDMSLVGPRPPLPREVETYTEYDKLRLDVAAGCTGLWQTSGRNSLSFEQMVELDLHYIHHRSIRGDLKIIAQTFRLLLGAEDAW